MNRRSFIQLLGLSGLSYPLRAFGLQNRSVNLAVVGCGSQGMFLIKQALARADINIRAVCDVDPTRLMQAKSTIGRKNLIATHSYEELLHHDPIDGVVIATPNHHHWKMSKRAIETGRHVFVEKIATHSSEQAKELTELQRSSGRLIQVGTNLRSNPQIQKGILYCQKKGIGNILRFTLSVHKSEAPISRKPPSSPIDWKLWNGEAAPFPPDRTPHYQWHFYWSYGGGHFANFGIHLMDLVYWIIEAKDSLDRMPEEIRTWGNRLGTDDDGQTPNLFWSTCKIQNIPVEIEVLTPTKLPDRLERKRTLTVSYEDEDVVLNLDGRYEIIHRKGRSLLKSPWAPEKHLWNFCDALVKSNSLNSPFEKAIPSTLAIHAINSKYRESLNKERIPAKKMIKSFRELGLHQFSHNAELVIKPESPIFAF